MPGGYEYEIPRFSDCFDVLSVDKQPDCYVICYTYGDFYSHEATRSSCVTVENGEMVITDMAQ